MSKTRSSPSDQATDATSPIERLIAEGETVSVERKSDVNDNELTEAVVCLANTAGGTLLIGITDDGTVRGARPRHGAATDPSRLEALVASTTRPALAVRVEVEEVRGKPVIVVRVPKATIPTATSRGVYLRRAVGGDRRPACVPMFIYETGVSRREAADLCRIEPSHASRLLARVAQRHPDLQLVGERRGARYEWRGPTAKRGEMNAFISTGRSYAHACITAHNPGRRCGSGARLAERGRAGLPSRTRM